MEITHRHSDCATTTWRSRIWTIGFHIEFVHLWRLTTDRLAEGVDCQCRRIVLPGEQAQFAALLSRYVEPYERRLVMVKPDVPRFLWRDRVRDFVAELYLLEAFGLMRNESAASPGCWGWALLFKGKIPGWTQVSDDGANMSCYYYSLCVVECNKSTFSVNAFEPICSDESRML